MSETTSNNTPSTADEAGVPSAAWGDLAGIPTTPIAPPGGNPVYPGDDLANVPTTPIAPPGGNPVYPGPTTPVITWPDFPVFTFPTPNYPTVTFFGQVRFLNASTNGITLDVLIDGQNVFSGSTFATVSTYQQVADGFHTVTVRQTNGRILYQQSLSFIAGEKVTMVILDTAGNITLSRVSDMGCSNLPSGYGCIRVANMSYSGSNYDIRMFNNQTVFSGVGYKEVTSTKQASAGNYTFFVTGAQTSFTAIGDLPILVFAGISGGCSSCMVNNPLLTYSINVQAGKFYTSYIIGNPWSNLYRVFTLED